MIPRLVAIVLSVAAVLATGAAAAPPGHTRAPALEFLGQQVFPTDTQFAGTTFGGLSGFAHDERRGVFYALSDDQVNMRFYTLRIGVSSGAPAVEIVAVTPLLDPAGQPFASFSADPEGLALTKDDTLVLTSEGFATRLIDPWVREFGLDGRQLRELPVPDAFDPNAAGTRGVRQNLGFESAATAPNGRFLFTGTEAALAQDGPPATVGAGSPARILRYNLQRRALDRQYVYWTDPIAEPPVPATQFAVSGLVELLPLNNQFLLAMERSFSVGAPDTGNTIKLYGVALPGADDVNGFDSLATLLGGLQPVAKTLLLDLDALGIPLDNVEAMAFGPDLPDGRRSLILVSDNNFAPAQFTQFLLFAVS
ncbi:MAG TPA: esterase-like activity of phytase family protein [Gaiellaceae bacterium]|nr:esterase-like activity of phytase family protein [Gaiellaceae bacterium]